MRDAPRAKRPSAPLSAPTLIVVACLLLGAASGEFSPFPAEGRRAEVVLVPLGTVSEEVLESIASELARHLRVEVRRAEAVPLPESAYLEARRRYRAELLLRHLDRHPEAQGRTRILGVTEVDISTTKGRTPDWGIFGLGTIGGRSAVLSTFRLRGRAKDQAHFHSRVATTAVHEVGHTLGLDHCPSPGCIMADARGSVRPVDEATEVCVRCLVRLDRLAPLRPLTSPPRQGQGSEGD